MSISLPGGIISLPGGAGKIGAIPDDPCVLITSPTIQSMRLDSSARMRSASWRERTICGVKIIISSLLVLSCVR